jgi:hypothetical protein
MSLRLSPPAASTPVPMEALRALKAAAPGRASSLRSDQTS